MNLIDVPQIRLPPSLRDRAVRRRSQANAGGLPEPAELSRWKLDSLREATWPESSIASGDLTDEVAGLKQQPGREIIAWGGAGFAQSLSRSALIDQYAIITQPVAFGRGLAMLRDLPDALHLDLVAAQTFPAGTTLHLYQPRGRAA